MVLLHPRLFLHSSFYAVIATPCFPQITSVVVVLWVSLVKDCYEQCYWKMMLRTRYRIICIIVFCAFLSISCWELVISESERSTKCLIMELVKPRMIGALFLLGLWRMGSEKVDLSRENEIGKSWDLITERDLWRRTAPEDMSIKRVSCYLSRGWTLRLWGIMKRKPQQWKLSNC